MEKNLVKKIENYIKPRIKKILSLGDSDRQVNVLSNIIKTVTGEEEGTKEFFEYYDYSMNKILYPDADMDVLNEAVEITLQDSDEYIDLFEGKKIDKLKRVTTGTLTKGGRRDKASTTKKKAEKANNKLEKAKSNGASEKKINKLDANKKKANMRSKSAAINSAADKIKPKNTNESEELFDASYLDELGDLSWVD